MATGPGCAFVYICVNIAIIALCQNIRNMMSGSYRFVILPPLLNAFLPRVGGPTSSSRTPLVAHRGAMDGGHFHSPLDV